MPKKPKHWLMKSEPGSYSITDLKKEGKAFWDGVRNYQARNFMMRDMQVGDRVLFYHSNADPSGITGLAEVCKEALPDPTSWDKKSKYYDPKSPKENPRWFAVTVKFVKMFDRVIDLKELRKKPTLKDMLVLKKGQRLSVMPVMKKEYDVILRMSKS